MAEVCTIREAVARARSEGLPVSEYCLRSWIRQGKVPVRMAGAKQLLYYPNLARYLRCEGGGDVQPIQAETGVRSLQRWG